MTTKAKKPSEVAIIEPQVVEKRRHELEKAGEPLPGVEIWGNLEEQERNVVGYWCYFRGNLADIQAHVPLSVEQLMEIAQRPHCLGAIDFFSQDRTSMAYGLQRDRWLWWLLKWAKTEIDNTDNPPEVRRKIARDTGEAAGHFPKVVAGNMGGDVNIQLNVAPWMKE